MGFKNMSNRERAMVVMAVIVVLIFVGKQFGWKNLQHRLDLMDREALAGEKLLDVNQRMLSREEQINDEWERLQGLLPEGGPQDSVELAFQDLVIGARNKSGVTLKAFSPREPENNVFYADYLLEVNLEGRLPDVMAFMNIMENPQDGEAGGLVSVREIDVEPLDSGASELVKARVLFVRMVGLKPDQESEADGQI